MRYLCAPDSFKESLSALAAAEAMARGIRRADPRAVVDLCPISDGGEGTVDAMLAATRGRRMTARVLSPLGEPIEAAWGLLGSREGEPATAIVEMAAAAGLGLVPADKRDPMRTTTFGVGQLIKVALDAGAQRLILGIGGSATNDGGAGMAQALGVVFRDSLGRVLAAPMTGGLLANVAAIDPSGLDPRLAATPVVVACDVTNPLTGPSGASAIYGPQKGATPTQVAQLDRNLAHLAALLRTRLGRDVETLPGAGAAGGMGAGSVAFLNARLQRGVALVLEAVGFGQRVAGCDWCFTGEGRLDGQSLAGKACLGVARAAREHGVPTFALVGSIGPGGERALQEGLAGSRAIGEGLPVAESMRRAADLLENAAAEVVRGFQNKVG
ncbi:MAG: glycerate kinase [Planctomycetota bacterium]|nr:glycerate kinase [Planctomycetota bacterium]